MKEKYILLKKEKAVEKKKFKLRKFNFFKADKLTEAQLINFTKNLSTLVKAKIPLTKALETLKSQSDKQIMTDIVSGIQDNVERGLSLAESLQKYPLTFNGMYVNMVRLGEHSGQLSLMLQKITQYLEKQYSLKKKILLAMLYPSVIVGVAVLLMGFIVLLIMPTFNEIFADYQSQLPVSTQMIITFSQVVKKYFLMALIVMLIIVFILGKSKFYPKILNYIRTVVFPRLPLIGPILAMSFLSLFSRTLGVLLENGHSITDSLEIISRIFANPEVKKKIIEINREISSGKSITNALENSHIFPKIYLQMIGVGEESSDLDQILIHLADYYEEEIDTKIEILSSVIEPLLILIVGIVVGGLLITMYLPLFDMVNIMGG